MHRGYYKRKTMPTEMIVFYNKIHRDSSHLFIEESLFLRSYARVMLIVDCSVFFIAYERNRMGFTFCRIRAENVVQPSGSNPSKRHRERLNSELEALAFLLPFENTIISRLDKLSILRLAVCFLQAKNVFQNILKQHLQCLYFHDYPFLSNSKFETENVLMTALSGFLLMLNQNGDVLYVSENVSTYLGFHQCDVLHQSVFDVVHSEDIEQIRLVLQGISNSGNQGDFFNSPASAIDGCMSVHRQAAIRFRCFMDNTCGFLRFDVRGKLVKLEGLLPVPTCQVNSSNRFQPGIQEPFGFLAACVPVVVPTHVDLGIEGSFLKSKHSLQLVLCSCDESFMWVLGVKDSSLPISFYSFIHEQDIAFIADAHRQVLATGSAGILVYRTSCRLSTKNGKPELITCTHRLLTEYEGSMLLDMRDSAEMKYPSILDPNHYDRAHIEPEMLFAYSHLTNPVASALPVNTKMKAVWKMAPLSDSNYFNKIDSNASSALTGPNVNDFAPFYHMTTMGAHHHHLNNYGAMMEMPANANRFTRSGQHPSCSATSTSYYRPAFSGFHHSLMLNDSSSEYQNSMKTSFTCQKSSRIAPTVNQLAGGSTALTVPSTLVQEHAASKSFSITQVTNTLLCQ
ncbi:Aryl hydrocarbon receptor protein 1 [Trichinella pseudospiralis]|uniref:Aryl hydrocarbon receptor protein 1 n=1 Tax=Trichinella pseudospiralis TaxID=6337 RepID=A0A0V1FGH6_TRIPS|nr:Aryl hydrocarbon receptor protein 1 [Trichinella pseudospiralis]